MSETSASAPSTASAPSEETTNPGDRALLLGAQPPVVPVLRKRYAVVVGISQYKNPDLNLRYAHRDAEELYNLICTPRGGGFSDENIVKLIDGEATTRNITRALRSFLQQPGRDDIVLIYLACHGAPDPNRPQNVYLITHDTEPDDIPGTALPMDDIQRDLTDILLADRVVLIADTCHSGAVGGAAGGSAGRRAVIDESAAASRYLQALGQSKPGMAILTSAEASETSREDVQWGGGHGVFTWHLLEGLRGKAENRQGQVTVGGLFDYVREQVRQDTGDQQHPVIGTTPFDRELPLAVTGDISTNDYFQLGLALLDVGRLLDDKERFRSAERQLNESLRLAGELGQPLPAAHLYLGLAQLARGDARSALASLGAAQEKLSGDLRVEAAFGRVVASALAGDTTATTRAIEDFAGAYPADWRLPCLNQMLAALSKDDQKSVGRALLIGISEYDGASHIPPLAGPPNDLDLAHEMLVTHFGFDPSNIFRLEDAKATYQAIVDALTQLATDAGDEDRVVIWYSGHAISQDSPAYLLPHDYDIGARINGITAEELHAAVKTIPAQHKLLVLDTHGRDEMFALAEEGAYLLALAEDRPSQTAQETRFNGKYYGLFSYELVQSLSRTPNASLDEVMAEVVQAVETKSEGQQTPRLVGNGQGALFENLDWQLYADAFTFSPRRNFDALTLTQLETFERRFSQEQSMNFPPVLHALGRGYLAKQAFPQARRLLQAAQEQAARIGLNDPEWALSLAIAQLRTHTYADGVQTLRDYQTTTPNDARLANALTAAEGLTNHRLHAVLVGVGQYSHSSIPPALGALDDVENVRRLLVEKLGADEEHIVTLVNQDATAGAIRKEFSRLVGVARSEPAFFYFAGNGSLAYPHRPTILPFDARSAAIPTDILLHELAQEADQFPNNLFTLIDAGWAAGDQLPWGAPSHSRYVSADIRPSVGTRDVALSKAGLASKPDNREWQMGIESQRVRGYVEEQIAEQGLTIGRSTLYPISLQALFSQDELPPGVAVAEADFPSPFDGGAPKPQSAPKPQGVLTTAFIQSVLERSGDGQETEGENESSEGKRAACTYAELYATIANRLKWLQPFFVGIRPAEILFSNVILEEEVENAIRRQIFEEPLQRVEELSNRLLARRDGEDMEAWLNLGIVQAARGDFGSGLRSLQEALKREEIGLPELCHEAHYHLGRVMTISASAATAPAIAIGYGQERPGDLDTAISELRDAIRGNPDNAAAYYFLGRAIFTRVEQEQLVEAEKAWETYLELGAPAGHKEEIRQQLAARRSSGRGTGSGWESTPSQGAGTGTGTGPSTSLL